MTPDLLALARQVVALPGFAWAPGMLGVDPAGEGSPIRIVAKGEMVRTATGTSIYRPGSQLAMGMLAHYVPDLTDLATGGAMLPALGAAKVVTRTDPYGCRVMWLAEDGEGLGLRQHSTQWCDWLGEAVGRVMVARGRWA